MLSKYRRYAIVGIFIVAAVFTPPDVFSQLMMATPLLILYEISILVAYLFGKKVPAEETPETS
jgi:sec-independent protein translocase protein TatC